MNFERLFSSFSSIKVAIVGDVMLDTYWWGNVDRISPEAPVPVVALQRKELRVGGAANVALNAVSMGAPTTVISVIGNDEDGRSLIGLLNDNHINTDYILQSTNRITTNKTRVMSRNQQMMRLDAEIIADLDSVLEEQLLQNIEKLFTNNKPDILIFEDYNKGVLTKKLISKLIALCNTHKVISSVDPKKKNFLQFKGVTIFKPNLKEIREGLNLSTDQLSLTSLQDMHTLLQEQLKHQISFITLSEKGVFYQDATKSKIIPTHIRKIADVSGAGDTVISVASLVYATTNDMQLAAEMANIAGGLVCEEVGTVAINKTKFLKECELLLT